MTVPTVPLHLSGPPHALVDGAIGVAEKAEEVVRLQGESDLPPSEA